MNKTALEVITKILDTSESSKLKAASILREDGIVALPTETVYGLAGNALSFAALQKIYEAKNRPANNPLIWHVHSPEAALKLFDRQAMSRRAFRRFNLLAEHCWPGPLTLVAKKASEVPGKLLRIAVRIPQPTVTLDILRLVEFPLAMPSANLSSRPSPTTCSHVQKTLNGRIDAIVDGGACEGGLESTVLLIDEDKAQILRPGLVSSESITQILDESVLTHLSESAPLLSPGQAYLHYAPKVKHISLVEDALEAWHQGHTIVGRSVDINELKKSPSPRPPTSLTIELGDEPSSFARGLYQALYNAEERPLSELTLIMPPKGEGWAAVGDRLRRAAGKA